MLFSMSDLRVIAPDKLESAELSAKPRTLEWRYSGARVCAVKNFIHGSLAATERRPVCAQYIRGTPDAARVISPAA